PDGSYAFKTPVPQGNYIVTIEPALKDDPLAVKNVPIPGYYRDGQTSPIRVDVIPGRNTLELRLGEPSKKYPGIGPGSPFSFSRPPGAMLSRALPRAKCRAGSPRKHAALASSACFRRGRLGFPLLANPRRKLGTPA